MSREAWIERDPQGGPRHVVRVPCECTEAEHVREVCEECHETGGITLTDPIEILRALAAGAATTNVLGEILEDVADDLTNLHRGYQLRIQAARDGLNRAITR